VDMYAQSRSQTGAPGSARMRLKFLTAPHSNVAAVPVPDLERSHLA